MANCKLQPAEIGSITVTRRGDGWRARARFCDFKGVTRETQGSGKTRSQAKAVLMGNINRLLDESRGGILTSSSYFCDAAKMWIDDIWHKSLKGNSGQTLITVSDYRSSVNNILTPFIDGKTKLNQMTAIYCQKLIDKIVESLNVGQSHKAAAVLRPIFKFAGLHGAMQFNPMDFVTLPKRWSKVVKVPTLDELTMIRAAISAYDVSRRKPKSGPKSNCHAIVLFDLMLGTGARIGELLALRWGDLGEIRGLPVAHLTGTMVQVTIHDQDVVESGEKARNGKPKSGRTKTYRQPWLKGGNQSKPKHRTVFLPDFANEGLQQIRPESVDPDEYIFAGRRYLSKPQSPHTATTMRRKFSSALISAGLDATVFHPHLARRAVASFVDENIDLDTASKLLGHSQVDARNAVTAKHYTKPRYLCPNVNDLLQSFYQSIVEVA